ncbi:MAG: hypothetical protein ACI9N9_000055 [Enterobacterales bacterium]|jgi:hypothetical protein
MDKDLHFFTQEAMRKHEKKEHMTIYEKAAYGGFHQSDLTRVEFDQIDKYTDSIFAKVEAEVNDIRKHGLVSFANDLRMDNPIMVTKGLLFRVNVYKFINGALQFS